jgi:hypothetical protein
MENGTYRSEQEIGKASWSWDFGGVHFVVLDTIRRLPAHLQRGDWNWWGNVDEGQIEWLRFDLRQVPPEVPVVLVSHIPLESSFTLRAGGLRADEEYPASHIKHGDQIMEILRERRSAVSLHGHLHENMRFNRGSLQIWTTGAVSGDWWRHGLKSPNMDGSPQGFRVVEVSGERVTSRYQAIVPEQRRETVLYQRADTGEWCVNVFDGSAETRLELLNEGPLPFVEPSVPPTAQDGQPPGHLWALPPGLDRSAVRIRVTFEDGRIVEEEPGGGL